VAVVISVFYFVTRAKQLNDYKRLLRGENKDGKWNIGSMLSKNSMTNSSTYKAANADDETCRLVTNGSDRDDDEVPDE